MALTNVINLGKNIAKRLLLYKSSDIQKVTLDGYSAKFYCKTWREYEIFVASELIGEKEVIKSVLEALDGDKNFYDIGANIGLFSVFSSKATTGTIVAVEPLKENFARLKENHELNNTFKGNTFLNIALSNKKDSGFLHTEDFEAGEGQASLENNRDGQPVEINSLDNLFENRDLPSPDVVKIDVEGHEKKVLEGFTDHVSETEVLFVEVHDKGGASTNEIKRWAESRGFGVEKEFSGAEDTTLRFERE